MTYNLYGKILLNKVLVYLEIFLEEINVKHNLFFSVVVISWK